MKVFFARPGVIGKLEESTKVGNMKLILPRDICLKA
jgi:hypothetical protein